MDDEQLKRHLSSIGKYCFIKYYDLFIANWISDDDLTEIIMYNEGYTEKASRTRVVKARNIIRSGKLNEALQDVIQSTSTRVHQTTRDKAIFLLNSRTLRFRARRHTRDDRKPSQ